MNDDDIDMLRKELAQEIAGIENSTEKIVSTPFSNFILVICISIRIEKRNQCEPVN